MGAAEPAAVSFDPTLLVRALLAGLAVERLDPIVAAERHPPVRLDPVAPKQHPMHRRTQIVVANPGRDTTKSFEGINMPLEKRLLTLRGERPVHRLTRARQPQREQETLGRLAGQVDPYLAEVDLGFLCGAREYAA